MIYQLLFSVVLMVSTRLEMDAESWRSVNDGVMGGLSSGRMSQGDEGLTFSGELSLENNGGFSSVRMPLPLEISGATGVRIEVRGDGREYQFRVRDNAHFDRIAWRAFFSTRDEWQTIELSLADFVPVFRGRIIDEAGEISASDIKQIGFLLADRNAGRFSLDIRRIEFFGPQGVSAP